MMAYLLYIAVLVVWWLLYFRLAESLGVTILKAAFLSALSTVGMLFNDVLRLLMEIK